MYLFSYFIGEGDDGLHVAASVDGLRWTAMQGGRSLLAPALGSGVMRDPSLFAGKDGLFHLTWTTGWFDRGIGYAQSPDLTHWSEQRFLEVVVNEPGAVNCWAPEIFYDDATGDYLVYWSSTIPGRFPDTDLSGDLHDGHRLNHRIYYCRTRDFATFSPAALLFDCGFNVIDATLFKAGERYLVIAKDETRHPSPCKRLHLASSRTLCGPYITSCVPLSPDWVEGPSVLRVDERWIVYYDEYTRGRYGAIASADLLDWEVISNELRMPAGARHGCALAVPAPMTGRLRAAGLLPTIEATYR
jgi:beta-xylosidase